MGGVPADLSTLTAYFDGGLFSAYNIAILVGFRREYPEADLDALLNENGRAMLAAADNACVDDLLYGFAFRRLADNSVVADPLRDSRLANLLRENSLGATAPAMPIYNYHALTDEIIPVGQADELMARWRAGGARVMTVRDPVDEHGLESIHHMPQAQAFLLEQFTAAANR